MNYQIQLFWAGLKDSLSLQALRAVSLDHPSAKLVMRTVIVTLKQVVLYYLIPSAVLSFLSQHLTFIFPFYLLHKVVITIGTIIYTTFYFSDLTAYYRDLVQYSIQKRQAKDYDRSVSLTQESGFSKKGEQAIRSAICTISYLLGYIVMLLLVQLLPVAGKLLMVIYQAVFASVFFFLRKWPYDDQNLSYMEKKIMYFFGFGFLISVTCNCVLSGVYANAFYFMSCPWLIFNAIKSQPPSQTDGSRTSYEKHRSMFRKYPQYRQALRNTVFWFKPLIAIRQAVENYVSVKIDQTS